MNQGYSSYARSQWLHTATALQAIIVLVRQYQTMILHGTPTTFLDVCAMKNTEDKYRLYTHNMYQELAQQASPSIVYHVANYSYL